MVTEKEILQYYSTPGRMTSAGKYSTKLKKLPNDVGKLKKIVQGLAIHEFTSKSFYGYAIPDNRKDESHIREFDKMLQSILALRNEQLSSPRKPEERLVGVCHHFAVLLVGTLRNKGIPARVRYGFGDYFEPGSYIDHSLCEYWSAKEKRWILVDPQFDSMWVRNLKIKHDVLDVPRNHFLVPGDAWRMCRSMEADPAKFGIEDFRGLWFVAGNLIKDIASLNKMEMLQWDGWGAMPRPNNQMQDKKRLKFLDELAPLSSDPNANFKRLRNVYREKSLRLYVPERVFNASRGHLETIK